MLDTLPASLEFFRYLFKIFISVIISLPDIGVIFICFNILRFEKSLFTDHKAVISGFDSNGYPLINCNSLNAVNMPFDFGWNEKNIKSSY